jgi:hypothetical protein
MYSATTRGGWAVLFEGNLYVTGRVIEGGAPEPRAMTTSAQTVESFGQVPLVDGTATEVLDQETADATGGGSYRVVLRRTATYAASTSTATA